MGRSVYFKMQYSTSCDQAMVKPHRFFYKTYNCTSVTHCKTQNSISI